MPAGAPAYVTSARAFDRIYQTGAWSRAHGHVAPRSGDGSTIVATNVTCLVLQHAVELVSIHRRRVRILDTPCGDWTWMPACLTRIANALPEHITLDYQGVDVVQVHGQRLNSLAAHT